MAKKKIDLVKIVEEKIIPYTLNERSKSSLRKLEVDYGIDLILECIETSYANYIRYDNDGKVTQESANNFITKIGGIAYNKNLTPIEAKIRHIMNIIKSEFNYYNQAAARALLNKYVRALKNQDYDDTQILNDFDNELLAMIHECKNWSDWANRMEKWESDINNWGNEDEENEENIDYNDCILPSILFDSSPTYISKICKQINCSYDNNLFDCTAVMMRRLLEVLLVLTYQYINIEKEILNGDGTYYIALDKIIKKAQSNKVIKLSTNSKKDMEKYKTLGNFSAHKICYNCTKSDIEVNILSFRALIEELMYKSGIKK